MLTDTEEQLTTEGAKVSRTHWMNLVAHLDPRYGGISAVLPSFCEAVSAVGGPQASLLPFCVEGEQFDDASHIVRGRFPLGMAVWLRNGNLRRALGREIGQSSGVHIHGLWQAHCMFGATAARAAGKPYIISAHGMLERWALRNKRLKKLVFASLIERRNVQGAACLHALTEAEVADYRNFGATAPIAVIPNGVRTPLHADGQRFLDEFPALRGKDIVLFLGRIHFKKGLDILARAWHTAALHRDVHLVLAGPDFEGTQARVKALINELGIASSVTFTGMLSGERKWGALAAASAFVLPSYSEGLSVSVLEAMAMKRPVIVSAQCNVPEVKTAECGWMIEPDKDQLASALGEFFSSTAAERNRLGSNGARVIEQTYSWETVGRQMSAVYEWLEGGSKPSDVHLDVV